MDDRYIKKYPLDLGNSNVTNFYPQNNQQFNQPYENVYYTHDGIPHNTQGSL